MSQNNYVERHIKEYGHRLDHEVRKIKKERRAAKNLAKDARTLTGIKAKILHRKLKVKKIESKKLEKERVRKLRKEENNETGDRNSALPHHLMDLENENLKPKDVERQKEKRKTKLVKYAVPIESIKAIPHGEAFKVQKSGKSKRMAWKRVVQKATFVPEDFTRKPPKMERFIRPIALRFKEANVVHPDLKSTFKCKIISVKRNPNNDLYTGLGILTKGTIIEVDVSQMEIVTGTGKIEWARYAQITNKPENDGVVNSILLV